MTKEKSETIKIGIVGLGCVGSAVMSSLSYKTREDDVQIFGYDKYKKIGNFNDILSCNLAILCLPTPYSQNNGYDKSEIFNFFRLLKDSEYKGTVVLKSTVEPGTSSSLYGYFKIPVIHNPEFLSEKTALYDFDNQNHIVIGKTSDYIDSSLLESIYSKNYPNAKISICTSDESESMKIFCNSFYASKIMIFNEFYDLCKKTNINYDRTVDLMLKNGWINKMHTIVPGTDGKMGYGGMCFPKDTNALNDYMKKMNSMRKVLSSVIEERNDVRED